VLQRRFLLATYQRRSKTLAKWPPGRRDCVPPVKTLEWVASLRGRGLCECVEKAHVKLEMMADGQRHPDGLQFPEPSVFFRVRLLADQVQEIRNGLFQPQGLKLCLGFIGQGKLRLEEDGLVVVRDGHFDTFQLSVIPTLTPGRMQTDSRNFSRLRGLPNPLPRHASVMGDHSKVFTGGTQSLRPGGHFAHVFDRWLIGSVFATPQFLGCSRPVYLSFEAE